MYIRAAVPSNRDRFAKKLSAIKQEVNYAEVKQFVVVSDDPEFCLGTTLLYITLVTPWNLALSISCPLAAPGAGSP